MTTTIATVRQDIIDRYLLGQVQGEPEAEHLDNAIRQSFQYLIGVLPPVRLSSLVVDANGETTLPAGPPSINRVFYVMLGPKVLFRSEWSNYGGKLFTREASVSAAASVGYYYSNAYTIDDTTISIDTDCIFGNNWLEEVARVMAAMQALQRLSGRSANRSGNVYASQYRVAQDEREKLLSHLFAVWNQWNTEMQKAQQERRDTGDVPISNTRVGFINRSRIDNPLTPQ